MQTPEEIFNTTNNTVILSDGAATASTVAASVTVEQFVMLLWRTFCRETESFKKMPETAIYDFKQILHLGREKNWLEDEDERFFNREITRRAVARIIHQFTKIELKIPDSADIKPAEFLKDLYTCRVCANHIAQVIVKKIMDAEEIERDGVVYQIFNHLGNINKADADRMIDNVSKLLYT